MSLSQAKFIEALAQVGLLTPAEIAALQAAAAEKLAADADSLARELVEQGKLSRYQAAAVYQGRAEALVLGNYLVLDKLGAGGMGQVFRARHRRMDRVVAIKVLPKKLLASPDAVARFQREVKAAARLTHPHIVTAYDADEAGGIHYLVMEYVEGQDLAAIVKAGGPMGMAQAVDCVVQAARGLEHAHAQGIIHRDVKPSNLLLDKQGTVKILDMGLARMDNPLAAPDSGEGLTASGSLMGTIDFMSPEQALDTAHADARSDIYSLGCTLYFLLTGKKPYDGDTAMKKLLAHREAPIPTLAQARPEVSADLEAVYRKMVAKRPENRYATMRETREALEAVQAGRRPLGAAGAASPVPVKAKLAEWPKEQPAAKPNPKAARSKTPLIAAGVAAVLLLGVGGWLVPGMLSKGPAEETALADASLNPAAALAEGSIETKKVSPEAQPEAAPPVAPAPVEQPPVAAESTPVSASPIGSGSTPGEAGNQPSPTEPQSAATAATGTSTSDVAIPNPAMPGPGIPQAGTAAAASGTGEPVADSEPAVAVSPEDEVPAVPPDPALERKAAEWVLSVGGNVYIMLNGRMLKAARVEQLPAGPFTVVFVFLLKIPQADNDSLANLDGLSHLNRLDLTGTSIDDGAGRHLAQHPFLSELLVPGTAFGDAGIEQLSGLTRLTMFHANNTPITDRGAQSLAQHKTLFKVLLANTAITDAALGFLSHLPLDHLHLYGTRVTDAGLQQLQACGSLATLGLGHTAIGDAGVAAIARMPGMRNLQMRDVKITERSVPILASMTWLTELTVTDPPISQGDGDKLRQALPSCKIQVFPPTSPPLNARTPATTTIVPLTTSNRLPVPSESELQKSLEAVKEIFGPELALAKKPEGKAPVAELLFKKAQETRDEPAAAYALLDAARDLAADAADAALLARIVAELGARFDVAPLELLADDLEKSTQKPHPPAAFRAISEMALEQVDDALAGDNLPLAKRFSDVALATARKAKDPLVLKWALDRNKGLAATKQQWDAAEAAKAVLATTPDDPDANLAVGRYLCFVKGDWSAGAARLALGSDATLKELGAKTAADPQGAAAQADLGEAWALAADAAKGKSKAELQAGARYWLGKALPAASGLAKAKIEQRLKQYDAPAGTAATRPVRKAVAGTSSQQAARDRAAAEWVLKIGGKIVIAAPYLTGEQTVALASDLPPQPFSLVQIDASESKKVTGDDLKHLEGLTKLTTLKLHRNPVGDAGLEPLEGLTSLQMLDLSTTQVTDAGLVHLRGLTNLTELRLMHRPPITGAGLENLKGLKNLSFFVLSDTRVTDATLASLKDHPKLEVLKLANTPITDAGLDNVRMLTQLRDLDLSKTRITDVGLPKLYGMQKLKTLHLHELKLGNAAINKLKAALPQCRVDI